MIAALPTIMHEYSVSASLGQLLTTSYIFTLGLISAMTAYLVHRVDSKKLFIAAMVCFVAGCAAALVAPNYPLLLASRLLQAGGAGIALPLIQVVALSVYPKSEYGRAMGLVGLIIGFAPAIGPTVSGFLIDFWGWRSVFVILGAVSAVVVVLSFFVLSDVVKREGSRERFDVPSGLCTRLASAASCWGPWLWSRTLRSILCLMALAGGALALFVFARRQARIEQPLLKLSCFRNRTFAIATVLVMMSQMAFIVGSITGAVVRTGRAGRQRHGVRADYPAGRGAARVLEPGDGRLLDRFGPRPLVAVGCAVLAAGTLAFAACDAGYA